MNLLDRYVTEVGKHLLLIKGHKDIEKELRSTLEDMLEDRAQKAGRTSDEAMEMELLNEYGSPRKVAATYNPQLYLIGPHMFPFFLLVLKIVTLVITTVLLILTGLKIATMSPMAGPEFAKTIGEGLLGIISAIIAAFGNIVLVFAILERVVPAIDFKMDEEKEWDPASLKQETEPDEVKIWEPILAIIFTFIALSIFNYNPQLIGIYTFSGDKWSIIPILTEAFFRWLPWINIGWVFEIILNGVLLRMGHWNMPTRIASVGIKVFQIVIGTFMLTGPSILAVTPKSLLASGILDADSAQILGAMAQNGVRGLIALIIFITGVDVIKTVYKLITQSPSVKA